MNYNKQESDSQYWKNTEIWIISINETVRQGCSFKKVIHYYIFQCKISNYNEDFSWDKKLS